MTRLAALALVIPLLFLTALGAGDDKKQGDNQKQGEPKKDKKMDPPGKDDKDKEKDKDVKEKVIPPAPPKPLILEVELKSGTKLQCEWVGPKELAFTTVDLGTIPFKQVDVRFVDMVGQMHRMSTFTLETFYGTFDTERVQVKLQAANVVLDLHKDLITRIVFPDRPRGLAGQIGK